VPSDVILETFFLVLVKSCYSCQIMSFMSQRLMSRMLFLKWCKTVTLSHCPAVTLPNMSHFVFVSSHVSWVSLCTVGCLIGPYFNKVRVWVGWEWVKKCFLSLRLTALLLVEGKNCCLNSRLCDTISTAILFKYALSNLVDHRYNSTLMLDSVNALLVVDICPIDVPLYTNARYEVYDFIIFSAQVTELETELDNTQQGTVGDDVFTVHVSAPVMDAVEVKSNITTESEDVSYVVQNIHGPFVFLTPQDTAA
jgi:hypothetical protein